MMSKIQVFLFLLLLTSIADAQSIPKKRLPNSVNSYQPTIVPLVTVEGNVLYFDRKNHPDNTNGIKDEDEIWYSTKISDSLWSEAKKPADFPNSKSSDVLFSISPDKTKYLIYGEYTGEAKKKPGFSITKKINNSWEKPIPLRIKDFYNDTSNYFGNLSSDGKVLLMSLKRKDSKGGLDLYVSFFDEKDSTYSKPVNLGDALNTKGVEGAPFLSYDDKTLYFSSNGHGGYGNLDLFVSRRLDKSWTNWSKPINLGRKTNSAGNETSICLTALGDSAYIVSKDEENDREGIYIIGIPDSLQPEPYVMLRTTIYGHDGATTKAFNFPVNVFMNNDADLSELRFQSNPESHVLYYPLKKGNQYNVFLSHQDYEDFSFSIDTRSIRKSIFVDYTAMMSQKRGNELIETVYFETNIDQLSESEKAKLSLIVNKIIDIPSVNILVVGHTDETGSDEDNYQLSIRRAAATAEFLKELGFTASRIKTDGKGKKSPVSENHDLNRRAEVYLID